MDVRTGFFALLLAALGVVAALMVAPLLQYLLAAGFLAFLCRPAHRRLTPRIGRRPSALALTGLAVAVVVVPLLLISVIVLRTVVAFLADLERTSLLETARVVLTNEVGLEDGHVGSAEQLLLAEIDGVVALTLERILLEVASLLNASIQMSFGVLVLLFVLYYLLVDGERFVAWLDAVVPLEAEVRDALFEETSVVTWAVIKSHVLVALVEGVLGGLGFYLLGVPNVAFWTVVMIVVSFLPVVGVWLVWAPAVGYLAVVGDPVAAVALFLYGVAILSIVDNYLRAVFVDRESGLHPAVVPVGVIGGVYLLGIMGLFLGPVLLAVFSAGLTVFSETALSRDDAPPDSAGPPAPTTDAGAADD